MGIQAFSSVGDGVHAAGDGHFQRQTGAEFRVIDHGFRQHARVLAGALDAVFGQAEYRGHFGASVGGGDCQDRQARVHGDCLAQTCGRAATNGYRAIGAQLACDFAGLAGGFDRDVHDGLVENIRRTTAKQLCDVLSLRPLFRGAKHQCPLGAQPIDFRFQFLQ
ncbi:hypothetical protein D3C71_1651320 [compost metagenome]